MDFFILILTILILPICLKLNHFGLILLLDIKNDILSIIILIFLGWWENEKMHCNYWNSSIKQKNLGGFLWLFQIKKYIREQMTLKPYI
jgi:hypothetical protein